MEIVIVIFPSLRRSFMFPSYPGNKPSVMGRWSCILCFTLNTVRLEPASHSRVSRIQVSLPGSWLLWGKVLSARCHRQRRRGDFSGNLVQSQLRCVNRTGIRTCPPTSTEQSLEAVFVQALPATTLSGCNQAWRQGICDTLCTHARLRLTRQDVSSRSDPAITVEPRQPRAVDCTNGETRSLLAWTM